MEMEDRESAGSGSPIGGDSGGVVAGTLNIVAVMKPPEIADVGGGSIHAAGETSGSRGVENGMVRKRRGRPRKYDSNGNLNPSYLKSPAALQYSGFSLPAPPLFKRGRGRPSSSSNIHIVPPLDYCNSGGEAFVNTAGGDFTPHMIVVNAGEDVARNILTFAQRGHRGICVLSAIGSVSNVTLRQAAVSSGLLTYEGRFEILTLTGSYIAAENGGMRTLAGGLSISVASPDGHVIGGSISGLLTAANSVQLVIGCFVPSGMKPQNRVVCGEHQYANATVTATAANAAPAGDIYPSPQLGQGEGESNKDASNDGGDCSRSGRTGSDRRLSPDINISDPVDEH